MLLAALDHRNMLLVDCRTQAYDNGFNMNGKVKDV